MRNRSWDLLFLGLCLFPVIRQAAAQAAAATAPAATPTGTDTIHLPAGAQQQKARKPLAGYTAVRIEQFTVENSPLTKDFPAGEEANLQLSTVVRLRTSRMFETVIDGSQKSSEQPPLSSSSANAGPRTLILSVTIVGFNKGSSSARFLTWPFPVGASEVKATFVFRDAANNQEIYRFDKVAKFRAAATGGIASKEEQMSHMKGGLVDALVKEIQANR